MHGQTSYSSSSSSLLTPTMNIWPLANPRQSSPVSHRHTMMFIDSRPPRSGKSIARPLSMTAFPGSNQAGTRQSQSELLPQPPMASPIVQPPEITQTIIEQGRSTFSTNHPPIARTNYIDPDGWFKPKSYGDFEFCSLNTDLSDYGQAVLGFDDDSAVIDLRKITYSGHDHAHDMFLESSRRMSESTNSMSSHGPFTDIPHFDKSSPIEKLPQDNERTGFEPSTRSYLEPTSLPRPPSLIRSASRSRMSSAPNLRSSPYTLESTRNKRWSTGMYPGQPINSRPANMNRYSSYYEPQITMPQHAFPALAFPALGSEHVHTLPTQEYLLPSNHARPQGSMYYPTSEPFPEVSNPLPSQGMFPLLSSNTDRATGCYSRLADLSDPPDLYSSLIEPPADPPEGDMTSEDLDLVPHEQELRFPEDLYTPKWVRGQGNKREGWCGFCKPGRWLVLKNSAFWYDKSFTHGVSAATGAVFQGPQDTRRTEGHPDVWEGLCGSCNDWIALVSSKKKGTTWFRHAYKCHTHAKVKDGPKRRREAAAASAQALELEEPTIIVSASTPAASDEMPGQEAVSMRETDGEIKTETQDRNIKSEDDSTPVSTPQLSYTSMSTPYHGSMQTPIPMAQTSRERKRHSVLYDNSPFTQSFTSRLEAFAEHETEHTPSFAGEMFASTPWCAEPSFTFNNGTFTQSTRPVSSSTVTSSTTHDAFDEAMEIDYYMHDQTFTFQQRRCGLATPTTLQSQSYATSQPPIGNWI